MVRTVEITYVHHNCFVLADGGDAFLFDLPAESFLPVGAADVVMRNVAGKRLFMFTSHAHGDHFAPAPGKLISSSATVVAVYSDDIAPGRIREKFCGERHFIGPGASGKIAGLDVATFRSNDEGVAFLIEKGGMKIYFGGDLAKWSWTQDCDPAERRELESVFEETVRKIEGTAISVAFSNADPRLANWTGAEEFIRRIAPGVFVPMHLFGNTGRLREFLAGLTVATGNIFTYSRPGDSKSYTV